MKRKKTSSDNAFVGIGIFFFIILLVTFILIPHNKNNSSSFSLQIKDPGIFIAKAGGILPLKLQRNFFFTFIRPDESSIIWEVDGGSIDGKGKQVNWNLPKRDGSYTVTVYVDKGKIKFGKDKLLIIVAVDPDLAVPRPAVVTKYPQIEKTEDLDTDQDGLMDQDEKKKRTNPNEIDTDNDGLSDYYEIKESKTNPIEKDTDLDGILDGHEVSVNEDPLTKTKKRNDYSVQVQDRTKKATVKLTGSPEANFFLYIETLHNDLWLNTYGIVSPIYQIETKGEFLSAELSILYDKNKIKQLKLLEDDLSICEVDIDKGEIRTIPSIVDKTNNKVTANLEHFSLYAIIPKNNLNKSLLFDLVFVIDDSGSMKNYNDPSSGLPPVGSDENNFRLEVAEKICYTFIKSENRYGIVQFSSESKILQHLTNDKNLIEEALMDNQWFSDGSTNIGEGLLAGINLFDKAQKQKIIILISDGMDTSNTNGTVIIDATKVAKKSNIAVYTIGLGKEVDENQLKNIALNTNGKYFFAENIGEIDKFFLQIQSAIQIVNEMDGIKIDFDLRKFLTPIDLKSFAVTKKQNQISKENEKLYGVLIGDSGFELDDNALPFWNGTLSSTGVCAGFAALCTEKYNNSFGKLIQMSQTPLSDAIKNKIFDRKIKAIMKDNQYFAPDYNLTNISPFNNNQSLHSFSYDILKKTITTKKDKNGNIVKKNNVVLLEYAEELKKYGFTISTRFDKDQKCRIQSCNGLDINVPNQIDTKWNKDEKELVNSIFRLFYEQPGFELNGGNQLYGAQFVDDIGILREMIQKKQAVILFLDGQISSWFKKMLIPEVGHAVVLKNIYSVISFNNLKSEGYPLYCMYIYDNNYPNVLMPLLVRFKKTILSKNRVSNDTDFYVFGDYFDMDFYNIGYFYKRR